MQSNYLRPAVVYVVIQSLLWRAKMEVTGTKPNGGFYDSINVFHLAACNKTCNLISSCNKFVN